jgi:hypothetical protein
MAELFFSSKMLTGLEAHHMYDLTADLLIVLSHDMFLLTHDTAINHATKLKV